MDKYKILVKGIISYNEKYLITKKWYDDRIADPFQWEFVTGHIEFGEEPDKAVIRLIDEQVGIPAMIDRILYTWTFTTGDVFNIGITYLCRTDMDDVLLSEELNDYAWIKRDEFADYLEKNVLDDIEKSEL